MILVMKKVLSSLLIFVFSFFIFASPASAKVINDQTGGVVIDEKEVVNDDLFIGAQTVEIAGTVNGDVFAGAQSIIVTGTINGSLHAGVNSLDISGTVKGNVYAGGQNITVSGGNIGGSLITGGATVIIDKDSVVAGSVMAGAGMLSVNSKVGRSVYVGAGTLTIGESAKIGKDLYYASGRSDGEVSISQSAKIAGSVYKSEINTAQKKADVEALRKEIPGFMNSARAFVSLLSFVGALIIGFIYMRLFGRHFEGTVGILTGSFWKSFGVGFLVSASFIPAMIILLVTVIGIPVAGMAFLMLLLYSSLAKIVAGSALGNIISLKMNRKMSVYGAFVLGLLLIYLLKMIPMVGFIVGLTVFWGGLGALTLRVFSKAD